MQVARGTGSAPSVRARNVYCGCPGSHALTPVTATTGSPTRGSPILRSTGFGASDVSQEEVKSVMELPRKAGLPVIGMFGYVWENNLDLKELHAELGPRFAIDMGVVMGGWNLAVEDPKAVRDVLNSKDDRFYSAWPESLMRIVGPRGRALTNDEAKPWRRVVSNVLSPEVVMSLQVPLMVQDLTTVIRAGAATDEPVSWLQKSRRIAMGVATRAAMGSLVSDEETDELLILFGDIGVTGALDFGLKEGLPGTPFHRGMQARNAIEAKLYAKIKPVIDNPARFDGQRSLVLRLYEAFMEDAEASGETMSNEEVARALAQDAFFLIFAGTDTTSYSLMRCALYLDQNPEWFQKLKDEQDALRAEYGDTIDRKVLSRSNVATALALEILRLMVPVAAVFRKAARDTTVQGIAVPKGTSVIVNLRTPTGTTGSGTPVFSPEQWLKPDGTAVKANDSPDNFAFGAGPRRCVGQSLATVEIITTLVIMGREIEALDIAPEEHEIDFPAGPDHPTGMPIKITPRLQTPGVTPAAAG